MIRHPLDYLEIIWQKPESTRKKIAAAIVFVFASIIIGIWFSAFSISTVDIKNEAAIASPANIAGDKIKDAVAQVKGIIEEFRNSK